jgi:hypothetical protein
MLNMQYMEIIYRYFVLYERIKYFFEWVVEKMFENNIIRYKLYKHLLKKYEKLYDKHNNKALKCMVDLYIKLYDTFFHDLNDSIELWMFHQGNKEIIKYIQNKNNYKSNNLIEIIESNNENKL